MNLSFYSQRSMVFAADEAPVPMAIGLCAACCSPVHEENVLREEVGGQMEMFCSQSCITKHFTHDNFHW